MLRCLLLSAALQLPTFVHERFVDLAEARLIEVHKDFVLAWMDYLKAKEHLIVCYRRFLQTRDLEGKNKRELFAAIRDFAKAAERLERLSSGVTRQAREIVKHSGKIKPPPLP